MLLAYKVSTKLIDCEKRRGGGIYHFLKFKAGINLHAVYCGKGTTNGMFHELQLLFI